MGRPSCINVNPLTWDDDKEHWEDSSTLSANSSDSLHLFLKNTYAHSPHGATADPGSALKYCIPAILAMFNAEYMRNRKRTAQIGRTYSKNLAEARGSPISGWQFMEQEKIGALQLANARNLNNLADCVTRLDVYSGNPYVS